MNSNENNMICGKNAEDNWKILTDADQNDLWFHLEHFTSPYVILKVDEGSSILLNDLINDAALLCKSKSKHKNGRNISVIYTKVKNVKKGDVIGEVDIKGRTDRIVIEN